MASDDELNDDARSNYIEDLTRLNTNSKPMINMLSQVAGTYVNKGGAETIVKLIYERLQQVQNNEKLNLLYLVDSIVKNVGGNFITLFERKIVKMFENTFLQTNNEIRVKLHKLRRSWSPPDQQSIFSKTEMHRLDVRIKCHDTNWPVDGVTMAPKKVATPPPQKSMKKKAPTPPSPTCAVASEPEAKPTPVINPNHPKSTGIQALLNRHLEITSKPTNAKKKETREKDKEVTSTTNDKRKSELDARKMKIELEAELEMKTDEGEEIQSRIEALNREKRGKPLEEKNSITKKVVELKKQLINIDDTKITIQAKMSEMTQGCRQGDINERLTSLATTKLTLTERSNPALMAPLAPPKKKKPKGLNHNSAKMLKKELSQKTKKRIPKISDTEVTASDDSSNDKPRKKKPRTTDDLTQPKVAIVPERKIPKKKPIDVSPVKEAKKPYVQPLDQVLGKKDDTAKKATSAQSTQKHEMRAKMSGEDEDAPDIPDPEIAQRSSGRSRSGASGVSRGVNDLRSGGGGGHQPHQARVDPREMLDKAEKSLRAGLMTTKDYNSFIGELFKKYPDLNSADPRSRGETKPWYSQTDEFGHYKVEKTKLDYRDSMWIDEWDPKVARQRQQHAAPPPPPASTVVVQQQHDPRMHVDPHPRDIDRRKVHPSPLLPAHVPPPETTALGNSALPNIEGIDLKKILAMVSAPSSVAPSPTPPSSHSTPPPPLKIDSYNSPKVFVMDDPTPPPPPPSNPVPLPILPPVMEPSSELVPVKLTDKEDDFDDSKLPRMEFNEQMCKIRNDQLVKRLYSGMPCTACGLRFLQSQTNRYADHLDFHYRQNRKEKEGSVATNRSWYYSATEWLQYEEIEDVEQRDKNSCDKQQNGASGGGAADGEPGAEKMEEENESEKNTVAISMGDNKCAVCLEKFDSFFHQDDEEWHYRDCVVDEKTGKLMHVQCAADADNILEESMITRTESISSIDELVNKPENEELEGIKSEPAATTEPSQETELTEQSESMEVEATIVKAEEIKAEVLEEEDLYGDLAEGDNETSMITT